MKAQNMTLSEKRSIEPESAFAESDLPEYPEPKTNSAKWLSTTNPYVFLFWSEQFDAEIAVTFVSQLRRIGLNVKIVGNSGLNVTGQYGIHLRPDMLLSDAMTLADQAVCIILPCGTSALKRLQKDPRVTAFMTEAFQHGAYCVAQSDLALAETDFGQFTNNDWQVRFYRSCEQALTCARQVGMVLGDAVTNSAST